MAVQFGIRRGIKIMGRHLVPAGEQPRWGDIGLALARPRGRVSSVRTGRTRVDPAGHTKSRRVGLDNLEPRGRVANRRLVIWHRAFGLVWVPGGLT